jgi:hypothetical protein
MIHGTLQLQLFGGLLIKSLTTYCLGISSPELYKAKALEDLH